METGVLFGSEFLAEVDGDEVCGIVVWEVTGGDEVVGDGLGYVVEVPSAAAVTVEVETDTEGVWFAGSFTNPGWFVGEEEGLDPFVVFRREFGGYDTFAGPLLRVFLGRDVFAGYLDHDFLTFFW